MSALIFTADFHQLTRGNFNGDLQCNLSYDPQRFWEQFKDYVFGQPDIVINACGVFHPSETTFQIPLVSKVGILKEQIVELDGTGAMLSTELNFPSDITELEIWFTLTTQDGKTYYDSSEGKNFKFRFISKDILSKEISVVNDLSQTHANILADFTTKEFVDAVNLRYRITNSSKRLEEKIVALTPEKDADTGEIKWKTEQESIPLNSVVAYDYNYFINGVKFKDDNEGKYFVIQAAGNT